MAYQRIHKSDSSWNPAFHQDHSESRFKPRAFSVQPEPDTEESEQQEIPAYSRADRDAISAKLIESMGGNVQTQTEAQVQKSPSEPEELDSEEMSMEAPTANPQSIQRQSEEKKGEVQRSPLSASITPLIQRDCGENMSCPEDMMSSSVSEEANASYSQEEPNASYAQETTAIEDTRSAGEHVIRTTLRQTALRDIYLRGDAAIRAEAQAMVAAGKSEVEAARWAVQARNQLRQSIRDQGEPIVDAIAQARRGARDMPTYESLRARGKTDAQIIESAGRSNADVNRWVGRIRIAGRILIAVDIGIGAYNVATAPEVDRPRVLASEVGRVGGALAGGWAGGKGGAAVGGLIGSFFGPGLGTAIGAGIGGVLGGIGGAIGGGWAGSSAAEWAIEQFYPPAETRFEGSFE